MAALFWTRVSVTNKISNEHGNDEPALAAVERDGRKRNYFSAIGMGALLFFKSIYLGAKIVLTHRRFLWLFPCVPFFPSFLQG
jgi:hypothetical protein